MSTTLDNFAGHVVEGRQRVAGDFNLDESPPETFAAVGGERRRVELEWQVLFEIVNGVNTTANLDELFTLIHRAIGRILYAENLFIALYNQTTGLLHFEFFVDQVDPTPPPRPLGKGLTGYVLHRDCPLLLTDEMQRQMVKQGEVEVVGTLAASWVGIPLKTPTETIGALVVQHYEDRDAYTEQDLKLLTSVGGQIALVIERKRSEEQLRAFAARLEQSNRELQDFASVASHDLQEPLRKIQAFGDRLRTKCGDALGADGQDYLARMQSAAGRMQSLINDLLTFSRVTSKAQPFTPVDLDKVANEVVSDLEVRIEETRGQVVIGDLPTIDADPVQMRQLLQNLIGNALKFHRKDEPPRVKVSGQLIGPAQWSPAVGRPAAAARMCQLKIEDNGIGFDEKYLDRIFTVFQRLHGRQEYEGTGVGLAVCRRIAEHHGGQITATSAPGRGATFIITLPVKHPEGENAR